jgi:hypothetical protein
MRYLPRTTIAVVIATLSFTGVTVARHYYLKYKNIPRIEIRNQTKSLEVISQKIEKGSVILELRHVGNHPLISSHFSLKNSDKFLIDYSAGKPLAPGLKTTVHFPLKQLNYDKASWHHLIDISFVLFTNGEGEGDSDKLTTERNRLHGMKRAFRDMFELVNRVQSIAEFESTKFKEQINALKMMMPADLNEQQKSAYKMALDDVRIRATAYEKSNKKELRGIQGFKEVFIRQFKNLQSFKEKET